ncbi:MAG: 6-N-hydroxylaminopurine resistance protein [Chloroflexi bacterium ADurb.Bin325]|nr:MAG: 6-N-hydroxylaminopurine resistance protein [Chloroflexi bacterium ADurb.Bin325]
MIRLHTISVGQPQTLTDARGDWQTAIRRTPVDGPIELGPRGLAGDRVADTEHHGSPDQAVSCHSLDHYARWNVAYGLTDPADQLRPGNLGENWALTGATEADVCVGDIYAVGSARVQVTGTRYPCYKQERSTGLAAMHNRAMEEMRTGFYLRVLTPGVVQAGDEMALEARPHPDLTLAMLNECEFGTFDPAAARALLEAPELLESWKRILRRKLGE